METLLLEPELKVLEFRDNPLAIPWRQMTLRVPEYVVDMSEKEAQVKRLSKRDPV